MFSKWRERLRHTLGFRLALWYSVIFAASTLALGAATYAQVAASLRQYDRETIRTALIQYAGAYAAGGVRGLADEIQRTQSAVITGPLLVRAVDAGRVVTFQSTP